METDKAYRQLEADSEAERKAMLAKAMEGVKAAWDARAAAGKAHGR